MEASEGDWSVGHLRLGQGHVQRQLGRLLVSVQVDKAGIGRVAGALGDRARMDMVNRFQETVRAAARRGGLDVEFCAAWLCRQGRTGHWNSGNIRSGCLLSV